MSTFFDFHAAKAVSKTDTCEKLRDLMTLHSITIEDDCLIFPLFNKSSEADERNRIRFADITYIEENAGFIDIVVRSGHLHILSATEPKHACLNLHKDLFDKSKLTLKEATDVVHDLWLQMDEAYAKKI